MSHPEDLFPAGHDSDLLHPAITPEPLGSQPGNDSLRQGVSVPIFARTRFLLDHSRLGLNRSSRRRGPSPSETKPRAARPKTSTAASTSFAGERNAVRWLRKRSSNSRSLDSSIRQSRMARRRTRTIGLEVAEDIGRLPKRRRRWFPLLCREGGGTAHFFVFWRERRSAARCRAPLECTRSTPPTLPSAFGGGLFGETLEGFLRVVGGPGIRRPAGEGA